MTRIEGNDLLMKSYLTALARTQGQKIADSCKKIYEKQRVIMEAEELLKNQGESA